MKTYTFIMSFRGGTFISQVQSTDVKPAMFKWAQHLFNEDIKHLGSKSKTEIMHALEDESPTPIRGIKATWFFEIRIKVGLVMCNVIQTNVK